MSKTRFVVEDKYDWLDWIETQPEYKVLAERFAKILAQLEEEE